MTVQKMELRVLGFYFSQPVMLNKLASMDFGANSFPKNKTLVGFANAKMVVFIAVLFLVWKSMCFAKGKRQI